MAENRHEPLFTVESTRRTTSESSSSSGSGSTASNTHHPNDWSSVSNSTHSASTSSSAGSDELEQETDGFDSLQSSQTTFLASVDTVIQRDASEILPVLGALSSTETVIPRRLSTTGTCYLLTVYPLCGERKVDLGATPPVIFDFKLVTLNTHNKFVTFSTFHALSEVSIFYF